MKKRPARVGFPVRLDQKMRSVRTADGSTSPVNRVRRSRPTCSRRQTTHPPHGRRDRQLRADVVRSGFDTISANGTSSNRFVVRQSRRHTGELRTDSITRITSAAAGSRSCLLVDSPHRTSRRGAHHAESLRSRRCITRPHEAPRPILLHSGHGTPESCAIFVTSETAYVGCSASRRAFVR